MRYISEEHWDQETKTATYKVIDNGMHKTYEGVAVCHPDDRKYCSSYAGLEIASIRAKVKMLKDIKNNEVIPQLQILTHLESNMKTSKNYNPRSYEARMLHRQINILQQRKKDLETLIKEFTAYANDEISLNIIQTIDRYEIVKERRQSKMDKND